MSGRESNKMFVSSWPPGSQVTTYAVLCFFKQESKWLGIIKMKGHQRHECSNRLLLSFVIISCDNFPTCLEYRNADS